jgi:hypothetical protein
MAYAPKDTILQACGRVTVWLYRGRITIRPYQTRDADLWTGENI